MRADRVIVFGSINIDTRLEVGAFPQPGETVKSSAACEGLGGKGANQAVAASRAQARTALVGRIGGDVGLLERVHAAAPDLDISGVFVETDHVSGRAVVIVSDEGENQIIVHGGANDTLEVFPGYPGLRAGDICLSQLEIPPAATADFFRQARAAGGTTVLNAAPAHDDARGLFALSDIIVVNETELSFFAGTAADDPGSAARGLMARGDQTIIVTLGANGVLVVTESRAMAIAGYAVEAVDTTGAGDCFCGVLCAGLAAGSTVRHAAAWANRAAAVQVTRKGAAEAMPTFRDIIRAGHLTL
jgi:ribokinase